MASQRKKVEFKGSSGENLSGLLEIPASGANSFALFAHCFTCGKDIAAASRIARALVARGIAVMRFDFTGLGNSDGDFANTNFSSNVQDLEAAADFLRSNYLAPSLLIGHSLGGTAVLKAAQSIAESKAVVTIGSPADASHVAKQFACDLDTIKHKGEASVNLAGRQFLIKKQFLDDIEAAQTTDSLGKLKKALLVFHSPVDQTVSIKEAEKIYLNARHPKSFVSLDNADHLLSQKEDSEYVAATIAAWAGRYLGARETVEAHTKDIDKGQVRVSERDHQFTQNVLSDSHFWLADEPVAVGGANLGPDPYEHLLAALGTCTTMTLRMYASRKKLPLDHVEVQLKHDRIHLKDCEDCDETGKRLETITRTVKLNGDLTEAERSRLLEIADRCPVHRTLHGHLEVITESD